MTINDIYNRKKKTYSNLMKMRRAGGEAGGSAGSDAQTGRAKPEPKDWIEFICDHDVFKEMGAELRSKYPIDFPEYEERLEKLRNTTGNVDACVTGIARIKKMPVAVGIMDGNFLMGSMGTVVGEKITLITEYAQKKNLPLLLICVSGGARMQEGLFSLMQMAKTAAAIEKFKDSGGLVINYLTHPTTGGVSASFATLGDVILAEPKALIGFAGPRVIEQTIGQKLPEGFQRAEFLLEHGMIDGIVKPEKLRKHLYRLLKLHGYDK